MSSIDSPDWQNNIQVQYGGTVTDAPDWVRVVSGPGGGAIAGLSAGISNQPLDIGLSAWTVDYRLAQTSTRQPTAGRIYTSMVQCTVGGPIQEAVFFMVTRASGLSTTQTQVALWDQSFLNSTPIAVTQPANTAAVFESGLAPSGLGLCFIQWTTQPTITIGTYYQIVLLCNGGTSPVLGCGPFPTQQATAADTQFTFQTSGTGFTSLATNAFASSLQTVPPQLWCGIGLTT